MTIDQVDLVDSRAWLTSELWLSDFKIMVEECNAAQFCTEYEVITNYDDMDPC